MCDYLGKEERKEYVDLKRRHKVICVNGIVLCFDYILVIKYKIIYKDYIK